MKSYQKNWRVFLAEDKESEKTILSEGPENIRYTPEAVFRVAEQTGVNPAWLWGLTGPETGAGKGGSIIGGRCSGRAFNGNFFYSKKSIRNMRKYFALTDEQIRRIRKYGRQKGTSWRRGGPTTSDQKPGREHFKEVFKINPRAAIYVTAWGANQVMGFHLKEAWMDDPQDFYNRWYEDGGANQCTLSEEFSSIYNKNVSNSKLVRFSNNAIFGGPNGATKSWQNIVTIYHGSTQGSSKNTRYVNSARRVAKIFIKNFPSEMREWFEGRGKSPEEIRRFFQRWNVDPTRASAPRAVGQVTKRRILVVGDSNTYLQKAVLKRIYGSNPNIEVRVMANKSATSKNILDAFTNKGSRLRKAIENFNPTNIIIGSLGGNDWKYGWPGNEALLEKYVQSSVIPLMQFIKDNNGSWTGLPPAGPQAAREYKGSVELFQPIRKKINDAYKKAAADVGLPYRDLMATGIFNPTGNKYHAKSSEYQKYYKQNPIDKNLPADDSSKSLIKSKSKSERKLKLDKENISLKDLKNKIKRYVKKEEESQLKIATDFWLNQEDFKNSLFTGRGAKTWFINFDDPYKEVNNYINEKICEYRDPCPKTIDKVENIINKEIRSGVVNSPTIKYWTANKIQELSDNPSQYPQKYVQWFKLGLCTTKTEEALKLIDDERRIIKKPRKVRGVQPLGGTGLPSIFDLFPLPYTNPED